MDAKKVLLILGFLVVVPLGVMYEVNFVRGRGGKASVSQPPQQGTPTAVPVAVPGTQGASSPAAAVSPAPAAPGPAALPPQSNRPVALIAVPPGGWGRNPFLTPEEIENIRNPKIAVVKPVEEPAKKVEPVTAPAPPPPPPPPVLPTYIVSAIVADSKGAWALIGRKQVRVGDKLGVEVVKDITATAVVLENDGATRRLPVGVSNAGSSGGFSLSSDGLVEDRK